MKKLYHFVGFVILIIILMKIDLRGLAEHFSKINIFYFILINLLLIPSILLKVYKWKYILHMQGVRYSFKQALMAYLGGFFAGMITPGRLGEMIKVLYLKNDKNVSASDAAVSVIADRLFDLYVIFLIGSLGFWIYLDHSCYPRIIFGSIFALMLISPSVLLNKSILNGIFKLGKYMNRIGNKNNKFLENINLFLQGFKKIATKRLFFVLVLSALSHVFYFLECFLLAKLLGFEIPFFTMTLFICMTTIPSLLPITIWGIGIREAGFVWCFSLIGLPAESAVSYSFLLFISFYIVVGFFSYIGWHYKSGHSIHRKKG